MLGSAPVLADALVEQLCRGSDRATDSHKPLGASSEEEADYLAANVWRSVWPVERCPWSALHMRLRHLLGGAKVPYLAAVQVTAA